MIHSLKPNVTQDEALRMFRATGLSSWLWRMRTGPLQRIADAYVPFRLYRVRYALNKERVQRILAMDIENDIIDQVNGRVADHDRGQIYERSAL